jgi:hypothetical protein
MRMIPDVLKMGRAMRQPGIDPRVWATGGRIIDEENTARWDADLGWVVDIRGYGSGLEGEEIRARVTNPSPYEFLPPEAGCEVTVIVPEGEVDGIPSVVGFLNNADGCEAPGSVHGLDVDGSVDETAAAFDAPSGVISPYDTEFKVSPFNRREEYEGYRFIKAPGFVWEGDQLRIGSRDADEPFVKGNAHSANLSALVDALDVFAKALTKIVDAKLVVTTTASPLAEALTLAIEAFKMELTEGADLSSKIKGE